MSLTRCQQELEKLRLKLRKTIEVLEELHEDPRVCTSFHTGECAQNECWIYRLINLLKED